MARQSGHTALIRRDRHFPLRGADRTTLGSHVRRIQERPLGPIGMALQARDEPGDFPELLTVRFAEEGAAPTVPWWRKPSPEMVGLALIVGALVLIGLSLQFYAPVFHKGGVVVSSGGLKARLADLEDPAAFRGNRSPDQQSEAADLFRRRLEAGLQKEVLDSPHDISAPEMPLPGSTASSLPSAQIDVQTSNASGTLEGQDTTVVKPAAPPPENSGADPDHRDLVPRARSQDRSVRRRHYQQEARLSRSVRRAHASMDPTSSDASHNAHASRSATSARPPGASPLDSPGTVYIDGQPCGSFCQFYMNLVKKP